MSTAETRARVILRPNGKVYIALPNAQAIYATPENIMLLFSDPINFLDNTSAYEDVGIEINRNRVVLDEVLGLTLASVTSDKRIICDFPELFRYVVMAEGDRTQPLDMTSFRFENVLSDEKSYLLRYYLDFTNNIPPSLTIERNIKLRNEVQHEIIREILNSFFEDNLPAAKNKKDVFEQISSAESALMYAAEEKSAMITTAEYAKILDCSICTVLDYIHRGLIKSAVKTPSGYMMDKNDRPKEWNLKKGRKRKAKPSASGKHDKRRSEGSAAEVEEHILKNDLFTKAIAKYIHTFQEMQYYLDKSYHEVCWDGQPALIIDVNPDYITKDGERNRDRMKNGDPPHIPDSLKEEFVYDVHHIGQNSSSPFAIIPSYDHNGSNYSSYFHAGKPNTNLHGLEFDAQRRTFWKNYIRVYDAAGEYKHIEYLNSRRKRNKK